MVLTLSNGHEAIGLGLWLNLRVAGLDLSPFDLKYKLGYVVNNNALKVFPGDTFMMMKIESSIPRMTYFRIIYPPG